VAGSIARISQGKVLPAIPQRHLEQSGFIQFVQVNFYIPTYSSIFQRQKVHVLRGGGKASESKQTHYLKTTNFPISPITSQPPIQTANQNALTNHFLSYLISQEIVYMCISERSYPRKLAFTYLSDLSTEFSTTYPLQQVHSQTMRPYGFMEFDTFISRTKATYSDTRATQNLDKLNDELRDVTKVMTKNIEDLLYRGDSLERMGQVSSRLREDSAKYRRAAVRINWELLLSQYGPFAGVGFLMLFLIWWRFF